MRTKREELLVTNQMPRTETDVLTTRNSEITKKLRVEEGKEEGVQKRDESRRKKRHERKRKKRAESRDKVP